MNTYGVMRRSTLGFVTGILLFSSFFFVSFSHAQTGSVALGDLDGDGNLTVVDLVRLIRHVNGAEALPPALRGYADVNGDGRLDSADVDLLADGILGIPILTRPKLLVSEPAGGSSEVGATVRPRVFFPKPILPSTLNSNNFYASTFGRKLPARIVPSSDGAFAWLFLDEPMPGASQIEVTVDGSTISVVSGEILDANADLTPGGVFRFHFATVSLASVPGTAVSSQIVDPGPDLIPRTADDVILGGNGFRYRLPIAGVKVSLLGMENQTAFTDSNGFFTLTNVPVGDVKVVIDGRTALNPPEGYYFPEMVMDSRFEPGMTNGVMTIRDAKGDEVRDGNGNPVRALAMYLPRVGSNVLQRVSAENTTLITLNSNAAYNLPASQQAFLTLEVKPGSLLGLDGKPLSNAQVGISVVPPELVSDMLPAGLLQHTFDITIQAPGVSLFTTPLPMSFPNVFNATPGTKLNFLSFDHTTGRLVIEGTATVSADGLSVTTDPGTGITHPGWHGLTPPGKVVGPYPTLIPLLPRDDLGDQPCVGQSGQVQDCQKDYDICQIGALENFLVDVGNLEAYVAANNNENLEEAFAVLTDRADTNRAICDENLQFCQDECTPPGLSPKHTEFPPDSVLDGTYKIPNTGNLETVIILTAEQVIHWGAAYAATGISMPTNAASGLIRIVHKLNELAGGNAAGLLRSVRLRIEKQIFVQEDGNYERIGNAPPYPIFYAAEVEDGSGVFFLRGKTEAFGRYSLFISQTAVLRKISFYDARTRRIGIDYPYLRPSAPFALPRIVLVPLDPSLPDSDGDGLPDIVEDIVGTSSTNPDTDGDGLSDAAEIAQGLDALGARSFPTGVIASLPLPGVAKEVVLEGSIVDEGNQTAYVALGGRGLAVVDVSRFQSPVLLGQVELPGDAVDVAVDSKLKLAVVAAREAGLHLVDIANPLEPVLLQTVNIVSSQVDVLDGIAYVASGSQLISYGLANRERIQALPLAGGNLTGLVREGNFLYAVDADHRLKIVDIAGLNMVARGGLSLPAGNGRLLVGNGVAYVAAADGLRGGFLTVDISDPDQPRLIRGVDAATAEGGAIALNGSGLAVLVGSVIGPQGTPIDALDVMNASNPTNTGVFLTRFPLPAAPFSVAIGAGIAFVADGASGLVVANYLGFDAFRVAPSVTIVDLPADADPGRLGLQVVEGSSIRLQARIRDDVQVRNVELLLDGQVVKNDLTFPFDLEATLPVLSSGVTNVQMWVRATDTGGNVGLSDPIQIQLVPDLFPPLLVSVNPPNGGVRGRNLRLLTVRFSEPLDPTTANAGNFLLTGPDGSAVPQNVTLGGAGAMVQLANAGLSPGSYRLTLHASAIRDRAGNALGQSDVQTTFEIRDSTAVWISVNGGFWEDPNNWEGPVPGANDDVFIEVPEGATVDHRQGVTIVRSLRIKGAFVLSGGTLTARDSIQTQGSFLINGGTLANTVLEITPPVGSLVFSSNPKNFLDGVTLNGDLDLTRDNSLAWVLSGGLVLHGTARIDNHSLLAFQGNATLNSGNILFAGGSGQMSIEGDQSSLTLGAGVTVRGKTGIIGGHQFLGGTHSLTNHGLISADTAGGTLTLTSTFLSNAGTIQAVQGGGVSVNSLNWENSGVINVTDSSVLNLNGNWTNHGEIKETDSALGLGGQFTLSGLGTFHRVNGTVSVVGTLDLANQILELNAATGPWILDGGTIRGGGISESDGAGLVYSANVNSALDGVSIHGDMDLTSANTVVRVLSGGLALEGTVRIDNHSLLAFQGNARLNSGNILFAGGSGQVSIEGDQSSLTLGAGVTVRGKTGIIGGHQFLGGTHSLINHGLISADVAGGNLTLTSTFLSNAGTIQVVQGGGVSVNSLNWENSGVISATDGSVLNLNGNWTNHGEIKETNSTVALGGQFTLSGLGTFHRVNGTVSVVGTLDLANQILELNATTGPWVLDGGTIRGGGISESGGVGLVYSANVNSALDGVSIHGDMDLTSANTVVRVLSGGLALNGVARLDRNSDLAFVGTSSMSAGTVLFAGDSGQMSIEGDNSVLTLGPGVVVHGKTGIIGGQRFTGGVHRLVNQGLISADVSGGTLSIRVSAFTNTGTTNQLNGGILVINP